MKKKLLTALFASGLLLSACGDDTSEPVDSTPYPDEEAEEVEEAEVDEVEEAEKETDNELHEYNKEVINNDNVSASLIEVEKTYDDKWDEEKIEVRFEVENKRDDSIEVQARSVSMNGKMVDESFLRMSQEVASGKLADAVLTIQNYDGEVPDLEEDLEMKLHFFSWDDMDYVEDADVRITFE